MSLHLNRLHSTRTLTWRTVVGLILVPLTIAGVLLWGLWKPTERLDQMTAAVVNLDTPVEVEGQLVPMGRVLAGELIAGDTDTNFTWVLTDEEDAAAGLDDGRYGTVVTIPENFSGAATSLAQGPDAVETATIDIATSDRGRLLDSALSGIVTSTATTVLNEQLGAQSVSAVFVGMSQLGDGIGTAAEGAAALADGGSQLAAGASELASGTQQLSDGVGQLASGATQLASGVSQTQAGTAQLAAGATQLSDGLGQFAAGLAGGATGTQTFADGVGQYTAGVNTTLDSVSEQLAGVAFALESGLLPPEQAAAAIAQIAASLGTETPVPELQLLRGTGPELAAGAQQLAAGSVTTAEVAGQLASGANGLAAGLTQLDAGVVQLSSGASQLSSGVGELAANTPALAAGATQLADGLVLAADGTNELAAGLTTAAEGVPNYTDEQAKLLGENAVRPVAADGGDGELFNSAGVPLFVGIALWAGALATFLVMSPLWRRTKDAARGLGYLTLRSSLPAMGIGAVQGAIAGAVLPLMLGYDLVQSFSFFGLATLAGVAFGLINQGLSALFGGIGRFVSFVLLIVAFAIGIISTAPPLLQTIGDSSPIGALFMGFQDISSGAGGLGGSVFALVLWALLGVLLTGFAIGRDRKRAGDLR